jgi:hypothetical protein
MNRSPVAVFLLGAVLLISVLVLGTNLENVRVSAGYACYVYARPIFGKSAFEKVIVGPATTGLRWPLEGQRVSITPYTYSEKFEADSAILAKDKLPLSSQAHVVWRLKPDEASVRRFMEEFGGWDNTTDPDKIPDLVSCKELDDAANNAPGSIKAQFRGKVTFDAATYQPTFKAQKIVFLKGVFNVAKIT